MWCPWNGFIRIHIHTKIRNASMHKKSYRCRLFNFIIRLEVFEMTSWSFFRFLLSEFSLILHDEIGLFESIPHFFLIYYRLIMHPCTIKTRKSTSNMRIHRRKSPSSLKMCIFKVLETSSQPSFRRFIYLNLTLFFLVIFWCIFYHSVFSRKQSHLTFETSFDPLIDFRILSNL